MDILAALTAQFHLRPSQVENTVKLIDDGNTIPFIARYRKEVTGSLDDQVLRELAERLTYLRSLDEQREKVRAVIEEQGALTEELAAALDAAATLTEIDDLYRPYRPKRKTRASVAKARGLQPLADALYAQEKDMPDPPRRTPCRGPWTFSRRGFPTTRRCASACGWSAWRGAAWFPRPPRTRTVCTACTTISGSH